MRARAQAREEEPQARDGAAQTPTGRAGLRAAQRQRTRRAIIDAALELMAERGLADLTMSALAERAGVSRPTLYKYFRDVHHVLAGWVSDELDRFHADLVAEFAETTDPLARVERYVRAQLETFAEAPHRLGAAHVEPGTSPLVEQVLREKVGELRRLLEQALTDGVAVGLLRRDLDVELQAELVHHLLAGLRRRVVAGEDPRALGDAALGLVLDGLRAR